MFPDQVFEHTVQVHERGLNKPERSIPVFGEKWLGRGYSPGRAAYQDMTAFLSGTSRIRNLNMSPTSKAILRSISESDDSMTVAEREALTRLLAGLLDVPPPGTWTDAPLLLTQKQAARSLGISRVTLWRLTRDGALARVEVLPGCFRYRREEVEAVARAGCRTSLSQRLRPTVALAR